MNQNKDKVGILKYMEITMKRDFLWPKQGFNRLFYWKIFLATFLTTPFLCGIIGHLVVTLYEQNGSQTYLDTILIITIIGMYYFIFCYILNVTKINELYWTLSDFETFGIPSDMAKFDRKIILYYKFFYITSIVTTIFFVGCPFIEYRNCETMNKENGLNEVCGLINVWAPFDIGIFFTKLILFLLEVHLFRCTYMPGYELALFNTQLIEHMVFRFGHVKTFFLEALKEETYEKRKLLLSNAIDYHTFVLSCAEKLSDYFSSCNFLHLVLTGLVVGVCGYGAVETPHLMPFMILYGYITIILFIGIAGQKLIDTSRSVGETIYVNTNWIELETDIQKDLVFILERSQKPVQIKAGAFGFLGYDTIIAVFKTAYSVLTLIQSVK